ncbi:hypothetical protein J2X55_002301 [Microbacterium sp. 1154]|uniref:DUF6264 family protein n=1 Tax=Microbacterium sp. 1154 TaxID=2817733 RepID=UPI000E388B1E|nr:DUF6264 family protein [Microbacterium sp. 1154]MDR6691389.1 hypothetical protein [Microbacterium sp. 1154]
MSNVEPRTPADEIRPRPQYGEYATPEEQRARIQRPEVTEALEAGVAPQPEPVVEQRASSKPAPMPVPTTRGGRIDRIVTFGLLVYGLFSVVTTIIQLLNFPEYANNFARVFRVDATFTNLTAGYLWGAAAAAVTGIGWLFTALFTWRSMKRGRISFWIPIVGALISTIIAAVLSLIGMSSDPQFLSAVMGSVSN